MAVECAVQSRAGIVSPRATAGHVRGLPFRAVRVLVVDDEVELAEAVARGLRREGYADLPVTAQVTADRPSTVTGTLWRAAPTRIAPEARPAACAPPSTAPA